MVGMRSQNEQKPSIVTPGYQEFRILSEIETNAEVTQRELSSRVGIALGLTNLVLRNLVQKGYLRATRTTWKRWLYTLTPDGFTHKIRLTAGYIHRVLDHYQTIRQILREELVPLALNVESRVAIYGTGEFAELVYLGIREIGIEEIDIFNASEAGVAMFLGIRVRDVTHLKPEDYDQVLVGCLGDLQDVTDQLQELGVCSDKLVTFLWNGRVREED